MGTCMVDTKPGGKGPLEGTLDRTAGQDCWTGLLGRTAGQDYWTGLLDRGKVSVKIFMACTTAVRTYYLLYWTRPEGMLDRTARDTGQDSEEGFYEGFYEGFTGHDGSLNEDSYEGFVDMTAHRAHMGGGHA